MIQYDCTKLIYISISRDLSAMKMQCFWGVNGITCVYVFIYVCVYLCVYLDGYICNIRLQGVFNFILSAGNAMYMPYMYSLHKSIHVPMCVCLYVFGWKYHTMCVYIYSIYKSALVCVWIGGFIHAFNV